jgi:hypothetical protein
MPVTDERIARAASALFNALVYWVRRFVKMTMRTLHLDR